jgi:leucyl-tRNA synthetase
MVARYGADATRMYALFAAPPDRDLDWQEDGVAGVSRFLGRVWRLVSRHAEAIRNAAQSEQAGAESLPNPGVSEAARSLNRKLHQTIAKITLDFEGRWHFNTCVAAIMELLNACYDVEAVLAQAHGDQKTFGNALKGLVLLMAPFSPYLAAELWEELGEEGSILRAPWPQSDPELAKEDELEVPVQINGKLVTVVRVAADADTKTIEAAALAEEKVQARIAGKTVAKVIVVPRKLVNLVVK